MRGMSAITPEEAETYRQLAESLHAAAEMPLEGEATDPLIEAFNSLGHQAADAITRLLSLATTGPPDAE